MNKVFVTVNVIFQEPFWVAVFERIEAEKLSVCKVTFGAEPKDFEVQNLILQSYYKLRFSPSVTVAVKEPKQNPKRIMREVHKQMEHSGIGTKSQQALKLQLEQMKTERRTLSREQREAEKERQFEIRQQKKKEKHRGR